MSDPRVKNVYHGPVTVNTVNYNAAQQAANRGPSWLLTMVKCYGILMGVSAVIMCVGYQPLLTPVVLLAVVGYIGYRVRRSRQTRDAALSAHADYEQAWAQQGDPRGTYGLYPPTRYGGQR